MWSEWEDTRKTVCTAFVDGLLSPYVGNLATARKKALAMLDDFISTLCGRRHHGCQPTASMTSLDAMDTTDTKTDSKEATDDGESTDDGEAMCGDEKNEEERGETRMCVELLRKRYADRLIARRKNVDRAFECKNVDRVFECVAHPWLLDRALKDFARLMAIQLNDAIDWQRALDGNPSPTPVTPYPWYDAWQWTMIRNRFATREIAEMHVLAHRLGEMFQTLRHSFEALVLRPRVFERVYGAAPVPHVLARMICDYVLEPEINAARRARARNLLTLDGFSTRIELVYDRVMIIQAALPGGEVEDADWLHSLCERVDELIRPLRVVCEAARNPKRHPAITVGGDDLRIALKTWLRDHPHTGHPTSAQTQPQDNLFRSCAIKEWFRIQRVYWMPFDDLRREWQSELEQWYVSWRLANQDRHPFIPFLPTDLADAAKSFCSQSAPCA